jgi:hypothetical protein
VLVGPALVVLAVKDSFLGPVEAVAVPAVTVLLQTEIQAQYR